MIGLTNVVAHCAGGGPVGWPPAAPEQAVITSRRKRGAILGKLPTGSAAPPHYQFGFCDRFGLRFVSVVGIGNRSDLPATNLEKSGSFDWRVVARRLCRRKSFHRDDSRPSSNIRSRRIRSRSAAPEPATGARLARARTWLMYFSACAEFAPPCSLSASACISSTSA